MPELLSLAKVLSNVFLPALFLLVSFSSAFLGFAERCIIKVKKTIIVVVSSCCHGHRHRRRHHHRHSSSPFITTITNNHQHASPFIITTSTQQRKRFIYQNFKKKKLIPPKFRGAPVFCVFCAIPRSFPHVCLSCRGRNR